MRTCVAAQFSNSMLSRPILLVPVLWAIVLLTSKWPRNVIQEYLISLYLCPRPSWPIILALVLWAIVLFTYIVGSCIVWDGGLEMIHCNGGIFLGAMTSPIAISINYLKIDNLLTTHNHSNILHFLLFIWSNDNIFTFFAFYVSLSHSL